jgi:hypothetical protein
MTRHSTIADTYLSMTSGSSSAIEAAVQQASEVREQRSIFEQEKKKKELTQEQLRQTLHTLQRETGETVTIRLQEASFDNPITIYRIGMIGCGKIGRRIAEQLLQASKQI